MLKIDLHIHTLHSGHAYGTIYDVIKEAKSKKMKMIAITDHGPSLGSTSEVHFMMGDRAPKKENGLEILWGCEADIINEKGDIDITEKTIKNLDLLCLGVHSGKPGCKIRGKQKNTESMINCFKRYPIHIFAHPSSSMCHDGFDFDKVCQFALDKDVLLELNLSSLSRFDNGSKKESLEYTKKMVDLVKKNNKKLIINSDAHFLNEIGDDSILKKYYKKLGLNEKIIMNNYPGELKKFIASKNLRNFRLK